MKRSQLYPMPEYFDRYINQCDDVELLKAIQTSIDELDNAPIEKWKALGDKVYAPGKWTVKDILQHLIDTERVFAYRATAFARGDEQTMLSFDEELYGKNGIANTRTIEDLIAEMKILSQSFLLLYTSFSNEILQKIGNGSTGKYSVAAIGFIIPGHQRWHLQILEEKYYPLLLR
jgi:DinB superfamily